jgi:ubiquinone/menaquinone biosynthesis C-methylase UbiE
MCVRDPYRFVNELEDATVENLIYRLESRAKDRVFTRLFDKYAARLNLPHASQILVVGCGTGVIVRLLVRRSDFSGIVLGVDQSPVFIKAARRFAHEEGIGDRVEFRIGDAHGLDFTESTFDVAIAHTVISHVTEPATILREMARVIRPGGTVAVFDGDYASLTFAYPDPTFGRQMDAALAAATFNNPLIMRDMPRLLAEVGLEGIATMSDVVAEIGKWSYFKSFAETNAPLVAVGGLLSVEAVADWLTAQRQSVDHGTFFASCNYYTYLARRPVK